MKLYFQSWLQKTGKNDKLSLKAIDILELLVYLEKKLFWKKLTKTTNRVIEVIEFCWKALGTRIVSREECQWKVIENISSISSETENR